MLKIFLDFMLNDSGSSMLQKLVQLIEVLFALLIAFIGSIQSGFFF